MTARRSAEPQLDLFIPYVADLPLRDARETMERPFFSLGQAQAPKTDRIHQPGRHDLRQGLRHP